MTTYFEYSLDNGTTMLIEGEDDLGGVVDAGLISGLSVQPTGKAFKEAFAAIGTWAGALSDLLHDMGPDEYEIKFGVKVVGEAGNLVVGKIGGEINYEVTLKWNNKEPQ